MDSLTINPFVVTVVAHVRGCHLPLAAASSQSAACLDGSGRASAVAVAAVAVGKA